MYNVKKILFTLISTILFFFGCELKQIDEISYTNNLSESEIQDGWKLLFNGETFEGWRGINRESIPPNWVIENGCIKNTIKYQDSMINKNYKSLQFGDLITTEKFGNFELFFEWKIDPEGNSGIKYNVSEELSRQYGSPFAALGFEFQILDDKAKKYNNKLKPEQYSGSLYDFIPAINSKLKPVGEFNTSSIILNENSVEHWLNGIKVVEFELGTPHLDSLFKKSKFSKILHFQEKRIGHIVLQNHSSDVWFRNIKIRSLSR